MARIRKIYLNPAEGKNYFVVDACFLANKYIPPGRSSTPGEKTSIQKCLEWWEEIDKQLNINKARVYIPDLCIAETFKVLAQKYYDKKLNSTEYSKAKKHLANDITTPDKTLRARVRQIKYHDISTSRDIIISVDRFYEAFHSKRINVQLPDLVLLATAKYLMDFYDIPKNRLHIVTCDRKLRDGAKRIQELPHVYDPSATKDERSRVFRSYQGRMI